MNDLQATARAEVAPVSIRGSVERFGLCVIAVGVVIATALAWVLTKVPWSWAHETGVVSPRISGTTTLDITRSLERSIANSYVWERHVAAQGALYIGIGFVILGVVLVLAGKAMRPRA